MMSPTHARLVRLPPYRMLEAWRGVASVWVALGHAYLMRLLTTGAEPGTDPVSVTVLMAQLGVTIFFVISGYCIANAAVSARGRDLPVRSFLVSRARRIYPPYYFSFALAVVAASLGPAAAGQSGSEALSVWLGQGPLFFVASLTLTQIPLDQSLVLIIYWSLCYEVAFYAIVAAAMALTRRGADAVPLLYALHALTVVSLVGLVGGLPCPFPLDLWPRFGLGVLVFHVASAADKRAPVAVLAVVAGLTVADAAVRNVGGDFAHPSNRLASLFGLAYALALIGLRPLDAAISRRAAVRWLAWVGTFSYSLYLTHGFALQAVNKVAGRLPGGADALWPVVLLQTCMAIVFARIFYSWCERPFIRARSLRPAPADVVPEALAVPASAP